MNKGEIEGKVLSLLEEGKPFVLGTVVASPDGEATGRKIVVDAAGATTGATGIGELDGKIIGIAGEILATGAQLIDYDGCRVFLDPHLPPAKLLICGAGHIALPLARFGVELGYEVTVIDDRDDFASPARFPGCQAIADEFVPALSRYVFGPTTYAVVITRGHTHDVDCLREILKKKTAYVGLIGSRRRTGFVKKDLAAMGADPARIEEIFTPIGLAIGGETPAEIALSIMAEITAVRRKGNARAALLRSAT